MTIPLAGPRSVAGTTGSILPVSAALWYWLDGDGHDPMRKAIKAREAEMTLRTWNAEPLFDMAKGDVKYDAECAATLANNLLVMTTANNGHMWPKGSDNEMYPDDTEALPEIWSTWPEIANKGQAYVDAVKALAEVAATGLDGLRSKIGAVTMISGLNTGSPPCIKAPVKEMSKNGRFRTPSENMSINQLDPLSDRFTISDTCFLQYSNVPNFRLCPCLNNGARD